jgi:hypothetical protein
MGGGATKKATAAVAAPGGWVQGTWEGGIEGPAEEGAEGQASARKLPPCDLPAASAGIEAARDEEDGGREGGKEGGAGGSLSSSSGWK